jgi:hypothetical protein
MVTGAKHGQGHLSYPVFWRLNFAIKQPFIEDRIYILALTASGK